MRLPQEFRKEHGCPEPAEVLDLGCSAGIGTRRLADAFPAAHVTGLDLSPHFLAVAELRERERCVLNAFKQPKRSPCTIRHQLIVCVPTRAEGVSPLAGSRQAGSHEDG